ncbi:unnamed protein product [Paramecium sonneborni]|uniref:Uncharacterized protein n=1 Tax=Paramecium sonneborni TaxID=65129 RepID=A0A8S1N6L6_9CILI|nr:unnamed protein product [Paramecium sonneborni]
MAFNNYYQRYLTYVQLSINNKLFYYYWIMIDRIVLYTLKIVIREIIEKLGKNRNKLIYLY